VLVVRLTLDELTLDELRGGFGFDVRFPDRAPATWSRSDGVKKR
jgi:hypothetical protein